MEPSVTPLKTAATAATLLERDTTDRRQPCVFHAPGFLAHRLDPGIAMHGGLLSSRKGAGRQRRFDPQ